VSAWSGAETLHRTPEVAMGHYPTFAAIGVLHGTSSPVLNRKLPVSYTDDAAEQVRYANFASTP
jgi:hypothetical protein